MKVEIEFNDLRDIIDALESKINVLGERINKLLEENEKLQKSVELNGMSDTDIDQFAEYIKEQERLVALSAPKLT